MKKIKKFICKFCNTEDEGHGLRCRKCGRWQKPTITQKVENKIIDTNEKRIFTLEETIGKTISKVGESSSGGLSALLFDDGSWILFGLDDNDCLCPVALDGAKISYWSDLNQDDYKKLDLI